MILRLHKPDTRSKPRVKGSVVDCCVRRLLRPCSLYRGTVSKASSAAMIWRPCFWSFMRLDTIDYGKVGRSYEMLTCSYLSLSLGAKRPSRRLTKRQSRKRKPQNNPLLRFLSCHSPEGGTAMYNSLTSALLTCLLSLLYRRHIRYFGCSMGVYPKGAWESNLPDF